MELTTEVVKDVTLMNILAGSHELMKAIGDEVRHIGNHMSERMGHLMDQQKHTSLSEEEQAELFRMEHLLSSCSEVMDSVTALVQVNDLAYVMVRVEPIPEDMEKAAMIKSVVQESDNYQKLLAILERRAAEHKNNTVEAIMDLLNGN